MRVALSIRYAGTAYHGWQKQTELVSLDDVVSTAVERFAGFRPALTCAGRTDAGVHAAGQLVDFETEVLREPASWVRGVNHFLPADVSVSSMTEVPADFSSRFSATSRTYEYWIDNTPSRDPLTAPLATWVFRPLDLEPMRRAASYLLGEHDFTSFRASACQAKTPVRTVQAIDFVREGTMVGFRITANAFLYHMVRNIVGCLVYVGIGRESPEWLGRVLEARDRTVAAPTFAPQGLYFAKATYPERFGIPEPAPTPWGHLFGTPRR